MAEMLRWGWLATRAANYLWDYDCGLEIGMRAVQLARDSGALEVLAAADNACGQIAAFGGDFATRRRADSGGRRRQGGHPDPHRPRTPRSRSRESAGGAPRPRELIDGVITDATAGGQGTAVQYAGWANSVLMNGLGRYEEALAAAVEASEDTPELYVAAWTLSELVEAATRSENAELAQRALPRLARADGGHRLRLGARPPRSIARALERGRGRRARCTARPSSAWGARGCGRTSHARISSTASGCAASIAASTRARNCAPHTTCS